MEPLSRNIINNDQMPTTTAGEQISLEEAIAWTGTYQEAHAGELKSVFFSTSVFKQLYSQPGATGIRIYNATNAEGKDCFVLVGATENGDLTEGKAVIFDKGSYCPSECATSPLNHS